MPTRFIRWGAAVGWPFMTSANRRTPRCAGFTRSPVTLTIWRCGTGWFTWRRARGPPDCGFQQSGLAAPPGSLAPARLCLRGRSFRRDGAGRQRGVRGLAIIDVTDADNPYARGRLRRRGRPWTWRRRRDGLRRRWGAGIAGLRREPARGADDPRPLATTGQARAVALAAARLIWRWRAGTTAAVWKSLMSANPQSLAAGRVRAGERRARRGVLARIGPRGRARWRAFGVQRGRSGRRVPVRLVRAVEEAWGIAIADGLALVPCADGLGVPALHGDAALAKAHAASSGGNTLN